MTMIPGVTDEVVSDQTTTGELLGLVQAQSAHLATLQDTTRALGSRLALRAQLDRLLSHELRAPITVILGALQALHESSLETPPLESDQSRALLGRALAQSRYLAEVVLREKLL